MRRLLSLFAFLFAGSAVQAQGFTPEEALKRMKLPEGFTAKLVASEPLIRQPLSISFDGKGRLWVLQYLQYPNPAGLKPVKQDQYLRTVWDKVPEPPPHGEKGLDRITILSEPDANGKFTKSKDFLTGLNMASGFCLGDKGVYVVQPPYLLFYKDENQDDVPDGDPEVLLTGFGMDDTHSLANSLQFGPDGWLYGAAGSTSTCKIKNPAHPEDPVVEFQQGAWRYHPKTKRFELFAEGGGNTYGLDFDRHGQCIGGTNYGGKAMLHYMQGAYYVKGFAKHGPLHNPHTYGYFEHVPYTNFQGGHVTCGGVLYEADQYPREFRGTYIAANLLSNTINWHVLAPNGSTFTAKHGGTLLDARDTWFRPVDCLLGPDGCIYVADWYDKRAAHLDPVDNWDKTNGRIYKIEYGTPKPQEPFDLSKKASGELVDLLEHPNKWWRSEARRALVERGAKDMLPSLKEKSFEGESVIELEHFWTAYQLGAFERQQYVEQCMASGNPHLRAWTIRLLGDDGRDMDQTHFDHLMERLPKEDNPIVLAQMACTAKRLSEGKGLRLSKGILDMPVKADPCIPLLLWWALEAHSANTERVLGNWGPHGIPSEILERLARMWTSLGKTSAVVHLIESAKSPESFDAVIRGVSAGYNRATPGAEEIRAAFGKGNNGPINRAGYDKLLARMGDPGARKRVVAQLTDPKAGERVRESYLPVYAEMEYPEGASLILDQLRNAATPSFRIAALNALARCRNADVLAALVEEYPKADAKFKPALEAFLLGHPFTARIFIKQVDPKTLAIENLRVAQSLGNPEINSIIEKSVGRIAPQTPGEKVARINSLKTAIKRTTADPVAGKELFAKNCSACHTLHGEGGKVGPDLTTADRRNLDFMLVQIVDPSATIRPEFITHTIRTTAGQTLSGLVKEATEQKVILLNVRDNQPYETAVNRADIDDLSPSPVSLMPEKLLDTLTDQQVADLLAYVQNDPPKKDAKKLKVVLVSGSLEYKSDESFDDFAKYLEANHAVEVKKAYRKTDDDIAGLDALKEADLAIFFTRRLTIDGDQLKMVKDYIASGKPIIGIRTASHGFQKYLEMDKDVFGGDYKNHLKAGPKCEVKIVEAQKANPILKGIEPFDSVGSLYKNAEPAKDVTILLTGSNTDAAKKETITYPIAWTRMRDKQRIFYTSLGHPDDFKLPAFRKLLSNAIEWTTAK